MSFNVEKINKIVKQELDKDKLAVTDGVYYGKVSGHIFRFEFDNEKYEIWFDTWVKGFDINARAVIEGGKVVDFIL